jgi:SAM-dependent methyltransferase
MNEAKQFWSDPKTKDEWLLRLKRKEDTLKDSENTNKTSIPIFIKDVDSYGNYFMSALEVGAGDGRLIGFLSEQISRIQCNSCDVNAELSKYVGEKYPKVKTCFGDVVKLPYRDNSFDLVYTYQVLQHVPQEESDKALSELLRVAKKEVWLMEGYDVEVKNAGGKHGFKRKGTDGGSFSYFWDEVIDCYEIINPDSYKSKGIGVKVYKIKK